MTDFAQINQELREKFKHRISKTKTRNIQYDQNFFCKYQGVDIQVTATFHCISQFIRRIKYIYPNLNTTSNKIVLQKMQDMFDLGREIKSDKLLERSIKHLRSGKILSTGNEDYCFDVDVANKVILTFELRGKYSKFNQM